MPRARAVLCLAALGGAGTMVVELAAVRLLAPWFGASQSVWTNVIGVILLALAVGYLVGAWLSRRADPLALLGVALLGAGAATALLPLGAGPVAQLFLPERLALDEAIGLVVWGSLASALLLFLLPAALLGMVAPLAVESVQRERAGTAGDAGGRVLAASTLGSLLGVFGTTHLLVPRLGLFGTFLLAAFLLGGAGGLAVLLARRRLAAAVLLAVPVVAPLLGGRAVPAAPAGWVVLDAVESPYQSVRISADRSGPTEMRHLQVNEAFDSFQSVWQPEPGLLPEGFYYNLFALPLYWSDPGSEARVLVLGLGAGTAWRVLAGAAPAGLELKLEGVELDEAVVELAREHMDLPPDSPRHRTIAGSDARVALRIAREPVDLVILDCYANQIEIPAHLATLEFLAEVRAALAPGGWLAMNVGGFGFDDPLVRALAATAAAAFDAPALVVRVPASRNYVVFARRDAPLPLADDRLRLPRALAGSLFDGLRLPGGAHLVTRAEGLVLSDDEAPLERLQMESFRAARRRSAEVEP
jgi:spermidine synthase